MFFVGGFTLIFVLLFGLPATLLGNALYHYNDIIAQVGGVLIIVFGIHTLGWVNIPFLNMTKQLQAGHNMAPGYTRLGLIGMAFGAGWTPALHRPTAGHGDDHGKMTSGSGGGLTICLTVTFWVREPDFDLLDDLWLLRNKPS